MLDPSIKHIFKSSARPPKPFEHSLTFFGGGGVGFGMLTRNFVTFVKIYLRSMDIRRQGFGSDGLGITISKP